MSGPLVTQHARLERTHAVADLFSALPNSVKVKKADHWPRWPRRVTAIQVGRHGAEETWRFVEPWALDATDQTLLLVLLALAAQGEYSRAIAPNDAILALGLAGEAAGTNTLAVHTSEYRLARECGLTHGGSARELIRSALDRLISATFDIERNGATVSGGAVIARAQTPDGQLLVAVNPYLARALLDPDSGLWVKVDLQERRALRTDTARLLHAWLCTWLRPGESRTVKVDTLLRHVWLDSGPTPAGTMRRRRHDIRLALEDIGNLAGWVLTGANGHGTVTITRPRDGTEVRHTRQWTQPQ